MVDLPFGFERPEDSLGFLLWQTTISWQRQIKKSLEPYDISHPQFVIMATLLWFKAKHYDTTQVNIAAWTKLDKMTVSKCLKQLCLKDLAHRVEHHSDTRAKTVSLTRKGHNLISEIVPIVEKVDEDYFKKVSNSEQQSLTKILSHLAKDVNYD